jgi:hypothetical protein
MEIDKTDKETKIGKNREGCCSLGWAPLVEEKENETRGGRAEMTGIKTPSVTICMSLEKREKEKGNNIG